MTDKGTTLVLGGTGKTGRRVAERLTARGLPVRIGSRSAEPPFDWEDQATWAPAASRRGAAYITYYPDLAFPGAADKVRSFAAVAVENGVRRLVLLSGRGEAGALRGEQAVQESGVEWTIVRSSFMNQNFSEGLLGRFAAQRRARAPGRRRGGAVHRRRRHRRCRGRRADRRGHVGPGSTK